MEKSMGEKRLRRHHPKWWDACLVRDSVWLSCRPAHPLPEWL